MQANDLLRADAEARRTALDVARSFIVQAPAGSGKTELLTQRYLALLAVVEQPEALLAITFTRKAAAEMRNRILEALRRCHEPDAKLRDDTRALARRALATDTHREWGLLRNPSRLRVLTIDALNQSLARRLPVLSGLGAGLGIDEDGRKLYAEAAERLLAHLPAEDPRAGQAVAVLLEHLDNSVGRLVDLIGAMLARREAWLPVLPADIEAYGDEGAVRDGLESGRRDIVETHLAALLQAFPRSLLEELSGFAHAAGLVLRSHDRESAICQCGPGVPGARVEDLPHWRGLAEFLLTGKDEPRKCFTKAIGVLPRARKRPELAALKARIESAAQEFAPHEALHELLAAARQLPPVRYEDAEWSVLKSLLFLLRLAAAELKAVFAENKAADYPEFAAAARSALGASDDPTDTALALDARLRHILVDEFQDTSEAQVELLKSLTAGWQAGDGRTLFLVGDPMQSIYRFRNAEVGLFLDVRDHGLGTLRLESLTLRVNFRSTRPIVEWVNRCFSDVLPARDDVLRGAVQFAESVAAPSANDAGGVHVHAFLRSSRRFEAQTVAGIVERCLAESADARVAILVQGRAHLVEIVQELSQRGIAFQATDIDPLAARPAVLDLLALTRALAHPGDRAAWLGVLRAPWCGLRLADLDALLGDDRHAAVPRLLEEPSRLERLEPSVRARLARCLPVLVEALQERRRFGLRDTVERAWHALGGPAAITSERELDEALAYLDALGDVEAQAPGAPVDLALLTEALQTLYAKARPRPGTRVELLTIHKSKGLQFDTVIVPGLQRVGRSDSAPLLRWLKVPGQGGHRLIIAPMPATGAGERNPLHDWLGRVEDEKLLQEKRRLLYVAATRAERSLHLLGTCAVETDEATQAHAVRAPKQKCALGLLWVVPEVRREFEARLAEIASIAGEAGLQIPRDPVVVRVPDGWVRPSVPAAPPVVVRPLVRSLATTAVEFDWATETARHVGTVVHRELQRLARGGGTVVPDGAQAQQQQQQLLARYVVELAELGVPHDRRRAAAERVLEAVRRTVADDRGRWLLQAPHREAQSELGLTGRIGRDIVSVVIDRTFVEATSGVRWIVDYKTSLHEGAGLEAFLDNERERYRPQLERYAALVRPLGEEPIRLGLYFPLLSAWREWQAEGVSSD
ncbi:MAG TPA: UvrD-helicase domain-containing protein [Steroidobacteraceae bacterium]|nr:UvrD-helicase domain-containing protein [Steroidobacteraceae bacterium]